MYIFLFPLKLCIEKHGKIRGLWILMADVHWPLFHLGGVSVCVYVHISERGACCCFIVTVAKELWNEVVGHLIQQHCFADRYISLCWTVAIYAWWTTDIPTWEYRSGSSSRCEGDEKTVLWLFNVGRDHVECVGSGKQSLVSIWRANEGSAGITWAAGSP